MFSALIGASSWSLVGPRAGMDAAAKINACFTSAGNQILFISLCAPRIKVPVSNDYALLTSNNGMFSEWKECGRKRQHVRNWG